jgi:AraC family transcriptional regulator
MDGGFGGTRLWSSSFGGMTFSETVYPAGAHMGRHAHPVAYFCAVRRGGFRESWRSASAVHHAGDIIFHAAGDEHANVFLARGARCLNATLTPAAVAGLHIGKARDVLGGAAVRRIFASLHRELAGISPSPLAVEGLVYQALGEAFQRDAGRADRRPAWLEHVRDAVRKRLDQPLTIGALAAEVGVHPAHLSRAFRRRFGTTLVDHLRAVRVEAARDLLARSTLGLAEVAAAAGFADQSHLTRVFKRATGVTPGRYRRSSK